MPNTAAIVVWSLVLILFVVGMFLLVGQIKRWLNPPTEHIGGVGFTLSDLRELHRTGKMSDDEFERAKGKIIEAAQKLHAKPPTTRGGVETKLDR